MTGLGEKLIDKRVEAILASMGGDLLSTYGKKVKADIDEAGNASVIDQTMATLGGYMVERFGEKEAEDG